jgi:hypothetical protein
MRSEKSSTDAAAETAGQRKEKNVARGTPKINGHGITSDLAQLFYSRINCRCGVPKDQLQAIKNYYEHAASITVRRVQHAFF